jgi:peroxiredoxin
VCKKELVQLERRHEDFDRRQTRVIVVSMEGPDDAKLTQDDFKHLLVLSDQAHGLSDAAKLIDEHNKAPNDSAIDAPTTILVDRHGTVRWLYRPGQVITRLSPDEVLQAIDSSFR